MTVAAARLQVVELRNYRLVDGVGLDFARYFEDHFLFSQREHGLHVLGQFEVVGEPDRFVWIRGFEDMAARRRGLEGFYGGAWWLAHRSEANAMMREHDDVQLLRPLGAVEALTGGLALEARAAEPPGVVPADGGLVVADFYRTDPAALPRLVERFEQRAQPAQVEPGHQVLGHFVTELAPNDYPRLPVTQDPGLLLVLSAYRHRGHDVGLRRDLDATARSLVTAEPTSLLLRPTARSLIRYHGRRDRQASSATA
jgi:hypothetical protein